MHALRAAGQAFQFGDVNKQAQVGQVEQHGAPRGLPTILHDVAYGVRPAFLRFPTKTQECRPDPRTTAADICISVYIAALQIQNRHVPE
jgi:hypothetical protein